MPLRLLRPSPRSGLAVLLAVLLVVRAGEVGAVDASSGPWPNHPAREIIERATAAVRDDPEASRRNADAALALLARQPNADLEIRARLLLCDYWSERDPEAARLQIEASRALLAAATRKGLEAGLRTCEGDIAESKGDNAAARAAFDGAVDIATRTDDREMLASALFSRGYLLGVQGQYAKGLVDLRRAQVLFEEVRLPTHSLTSLNSIAILYNRMGDFASAKDIYERALKAQRAAGMRREQGVTLHNIGRVHEKLGEWDLAQRAFAEARTMHAAIGYGRGEAYAIRGLAAVANARGEPQAALDLLRRAAELQRQTPDARLLAQIDLARGMALRQLGRNGDALAALEAASRVFENGEALSELTQTHRELAVTYAAGNAWRDAYQAERRANEIEESLLRNQLDQRFAALKVEFDTATKEEQNALLVRENAAQQAALVHERRARNLQAAVIALTVVLAIVLGMLAYRLRRGTHAMRTLALTDELTGVPNRRAVLQRLDLLLANAPAAPIALLVVDLDHFKNINDELGHAIGDEVLREVGRLLREAIREPAFFGRLGGEEFVVVLPDADVAAGLVVGENLRQRVMALDIGRWVPDARSITTSIGVTQRDGDTDTTSSLLGRADHALYAAKRAGRNRVCVYGQPEPPPCDASAERRALRA